MATSSTPYGLRPKASPSGDRMGGVALSVPACVQAGYNTALYQGQPVTLSGGYVTAVTGNAPTGIVGIFAQLPAESENDTTGDYTGHYRANSAQRDIVVNLYSNTDAYFQIQSGGALTQAAVGSYAGLGSIGTGTAGGRSSCILTASSVNATYNASNHCLRIVGFASPVTDAFPDMVVQILKRNSFNY